MDITWSIPSGIQERIGDYFSTAALQKAVQLLKEGRVSISFSKGDLNGHLIHSGLVRDDRSHECKIVYKKRLEGSEVGPLGSNCDCLEWSAQGHCLHTAALMLSFLFQDQIDTSVDNPSERPPLNLNTSFGVSVDEYGHIVKGPHDFIGDGSGQTYTAQQYLLHDRRVINFPIPENFKGHLVIKLDSNPNAINLFTFSYIDEEGLEHKEISLFENLYLFFWKSGSALHLNTELKNFVQKLRLGRHKLKLNDCLRLAQGPKLAEHLKVVIDDCPWEDIPERTPMPRILLSPANKRSLIQMELVFHDDQDQLLPIPEGLWAFTHQGGHLQHFKRKRDAHEFIQELVLSFKQGHDLYKQAVIGQKNRNDWFDLVEQLTQTESTWLYDDQRQVLAHYDNRLLRELLCAFQEFFGDQFFRFSRYHEETHSLEYQVAASQIFQGLQEFNARFLPYGVSVYYDRQEISRWSSRIRFERRSTATQWFDLELNLTEEDLEIVSQADLNNGLAVTKKGLVLLTNEQKDLVRFMKKYTQYEGQKQELAQEGDLDQEGEEQTHKFVLPFQRARIFELFELKKLGIDGALTQEELKLCERLMTLEALPEYDIPEKAGAVMRSYQKTGYHWLRFLHESRLGACLADDMGLGKTLQAIAFLQSQYEKLNKVLIVCPVSILLNWQHEFEKFSDMPIQIYHGGEREIDSDKKIILTSYGVMKKEAVETFKDTHFDVVILDEVQHLKNIRSLGAYAARQLTADFRICLTGTPVENDLSEFYNILDLCIPGIWGDLQFIKTTSNAKSRLLARKTASPFILRRTKSQVLTDLPAKIENNVFLSFTEDERKKYVNNLVGIRNRIQSSPSKRKYGEILKGLLELRQMCLWQQQEAALGMAPHNIESTKIEFLEENLEQILEEGHQAIVFSQFTTYLDIIQNILAKKHMKLSRIDGSQSIKRRQKEVEKFQASETQVFLISLKAGGVGLNLTAASYVFIMDPWWNPAVEAQAIDRAHRIGQQNQLTVYRPIVKDSVEEKVLKLQEMKKQLFHDLLPDNDDNYFTGKLTMRDFESLFS